MAVVCCDTSFLFALYGNDAHTPKAIAEVRRLRTALAISPLNEYELSNAIRLAVFRGLRSQAEATAILAAFAADLAAGRLHLPVCNLALVLMEAKRISATHTQTTGHRSFDILHVAAGIYFGASLFFTFDARQQTLAKVEGLKPRP